VARAEGGRERAAARAVVVVEHLGPLEEAVGSDQRFERGHRDEVVVATVDLVRALPACGVRDADAQVRLAREQFAHEAGLARARGRGDHEQAGAGGYGACRHRRNMPEGGAKRNRWRRRRSP